MQSAFGVEHVSKMVVKRPPKTVVRVKGKGYLVGHKVAEAVHKPTPLRTLNGVHRYG